MKSSPVAGFSLMEMIVALLIMSILTAIALPTYTSYLTRSRRVDATIGLNLAARMLERYNVEHDSYTGAVLGNGVSDAGVYPAATPSGFYILTLKVDRSSVLPAGSSYLLQATPTGSQSSDTECGIFTLDETGFKTAAGASDPDTLARCWLAS
ncbi:MAG: type IV pilin protein [Rhodocyclaceae bacterium]|nr:type IV pilin protein [Rhodocyclaceae bacterium]